MSMGWAYLKEVSYKDDVVSSPERGEWSGPRGKLRKNLIWSLIGDDLNLSFLALFTNYFFDPLYQSLRLNLIDR